MKQSIAGSRHLITFVVIVVASLTAASAMAQSLRFVTGDFTSVRARYDEPGATTTITTPGGRQCGPNQTAMDPCQGGIYPFVAGQNVAPIRPTGAIHQAGLAIGDDLNMPLQSEWTRMTSGMIPAGFIPGVLSIWTLFDGRNDIALPATGKGLAAGGGPGSFVWNPAGAGVPASTMFQTYQFMSGNDPGQTTANAGTLISTNFPSVPPLTQRATYTAGPNQFGGTAGVLSDTPNRLTLDFVTAIFQRTNGKCPQAAPIGDCASGFRWGTEHRQTSVRRNVNQTNPAIVLGQHGYWHSNEWTTGTVSVRDDFAFPGNQLEWFALSGTDTITSMGARHVVLVSPVLNYDRSLFGSPQTGGQIGVWDMVIQTPEPAAGLGLMAGMGLLMGLHRSARRRRV